MFPSLAMTINGPEATIIIFAIFMAFLMYGGAEDRHFNPQKAEITAGREDEMRKLDHPLRAARRDHPRRPAARGRRRLRAARTHHLHRTDPAHRRVTAAGPHHHKELTVNTQTHGTAATAPRASGLTANSPTTNGLCTRNGRVTVRAISGPAPSQLEADAAMKAIVHDEYGSPRFYGSKRSSGRARG